MKELKKVYKKTEKEINKAKNRIQYSTSLDENLVKKLKLVAVEKNTTANNLIENALRKYL